MVAPPHSTSTVAAVRGMREQLALLENDLADGERADVDPADGERIDVLRALEELKSGAAAAQARLSAAFARSQRCAQAAAGVPPPRRGRGLGPQVALARRESPHRGQRHLALAAILVNEMPHTLEAMTRGQLTEWQATLLAQETATLTAEQRAHVDETLCAEPSHLEELLKHQGDRGVSNAARRMAQRLDPAAAVARAARATQDRHVSTRPKPDTMVQLSALLPMAQGVAVYAALKRAADTLRAQGDPRARAQVMADTLVERITGQPQADAVPVAVNLVMAHDTLLDPTGKDADSDLLHSPAFVPGYGPVPAGVARDLVRHAIKTLTPAAAATIRRLYTHPTTKQLIAMDSTARCFPTGLSHLIAMRDAGICRTPWCSAPIAHLDHIEAAEHGGATSEANGQGLCEQCNHAKQAPGWDAEPRPGPTHTVRTTTPTGHTYDSTAPPLAGARIRLRLDYISAA